MHDSENDRVLEKLEGIILGNISKHYSLCTETLQLLGAGVQSAEAVREAYIGSLYNCYGNPMVSFSEDPLFSGIDASTIFEADTLDAFANLRHSLGIPVGDYKSAKAWENVFELRQISLNRGQIVQLARSSSRQSSTALSDVLLADICAIILTVIPNPDVLDDSSPAEQSLDPRNLQRLLDFVDPVPIVDQYIACLRTETKDQILDLRSLLAQLFMFSKILSVDSIWNSHILPSQLSVKQVKEKLVEGLVFALKCAVKCKSMSTVSSASLSSDASFISPEFLLPQLLSCARFHVDSLRPYIAYTPSAVQFPIHAEDRGYTLQDELLGSIAKFASVFGLTSMRATAETIVSVSERITNRISQYDCRCKSLFACTCAVLPRAC